MELACLALFAALAIAMVLRLTSRTRVSREERAAAADLAALATPTAAPSAAAPSAESSAAPSARPTIRPELFELRMENPDFQGLLRFEADRTLYVCQADDNSYYMSHRFDGSEDPAGMIFMDCRDSLWPRSDNLILYGHNMRDGSRFGTLSHFERASHMKQYPIFQFVDLYETVDYVPIAIFHTTVLADDPSYYPFDRTDFANEADFDRYIGDVQARSLIQIPLTAKYGERLLTLATCSSAETRGRLVLVLREVRPGETFGS